MHIEDLFILFMSPSNLIGIFRFDKILEKKSSDL
jgi:hypothetical protein